MQKTNATTLKSMISYGSLIIGLYHLIGFSFFFCLFLTVYFEQDQLPRWMAIFLGISIGFTLSYRHLRQWYKGMSGGLVELAVPVVPLPHGEPHILKFDLFKDIQADVWRTKITIEHINNNSTFNDVWSQYFPAHVSGTRQAQSTVTLPADMPCTTESSNGANDYFVVNLTLYADKQEWHFALWTCPAAPQA